MHWLHVVPVEEQLAQKGMIASQVKHLPFLLKNLGAQVWQATLLRHVMQPGSTVEHGWHREPCSFAKT